jgi:hypothetical protein
MEKKKVGQYILIIGGIIATGGLLLFLKSQKSVKAAIPSEKPEAEATVTKNTAGDIIIENYDSIWDYKFSGDRWYTKKKISSTWLDMKDSLSPENYAVAIKRLSDFVKK